jgi:predicted AAA+ superfamily ATPase
VIALGPPSARRSELLQALARVLALAERLLRRVLGEPAADGPAAAAAARAYRWRAGALTPIANPDVPELGQLLGVEASLRRLRANTRALCAGAPALDVLLYGDRGTGKSSAVRGLLGEFAAQGLHLVELDRGELGSLPELLAELRGRRGVFLVVCDDLSFDADDVSYRTLKAALDGTLEARPPHVRIAATSNRRHLIAERHAENSESGELHPGETTDEKLSLADRFGLTLPFFAFDPPTYLRIVDQHARTLGLAELLPREDLHACALRIALERGGRSGRTAHHACVRLLQELREVP